MPRRTPPTAAEVHCWVAHLYRVEANAIHYAHPRAEDASERAAELDAAGDAHYEHAKTAYGLKRGLWRRAMRKWAEPEAGRGKE